MERSYGVLKSTFFLLLFGSPHLSVFALFFFPFLSFISSRFLFFFVFRRSVLRGFITSPFWGRFFDSPNLDGLSMEDEI